ncbi:MAG: FkbM family methyltransferase [Gluconacetobacter diazotrophicus]|nr:FkbM family methyltransferase [Gluconacetobacter diazotrophicus]
MRPRTPLSAVAFKAYLELAPGHKGRERVLQHLAGVLSASGQPFIWRMKNGLKVAISSDDVWAGCGVGYTCLQVGAWEPHVEAWVGRLLRPGDVAVDIGANLGYFSAVMSQRVGAQGRVFAFEPVPKTLLQLHLTKLANRSENLTIYPVAVGEADSVVDIRFEPGVAGNASAFQRFHAGRTQVARVALKSLDSLSASGVLPDAQLLKIDVEGNELNVLAGATAYLRRARPSIIFEYNAETARSAGWTLADARAVLADCGRYECSIINGNGTLLPVDLGTLKTSDDGYIDILAVPHPTP